MYEWSDMSTRKTGRLGIRIICTSGATCLQARLVKMRVDVVQIKAEIIIISLKCMLFLS
jgi:hypothetical protein